MGVGKGPLETPHDRSLDLMNRQSRIRTLGIVVLISFFFAGSALAQRPGVRQARQRTRIAAGVESGALRKGETRALRAEQRHIRHTKQRMRAGDGRLGPKERRRLDRMQDRASRHIRRAKHNGRTR